MNTYFDKFSINSEKEDFQVIFNNIDKGVVFRGTNLWVLIIAIFVASLGLNVNSTAVIIGAMLISPLMGPIMGIGLGMGINDTALVRKAIYNFLIATVTALATSTIFFFLSPLNDAHSEILARTSPNIYDVLIALFGGLAGMLAISSSKKGNVIPGVAIATALMPPLCTAGYGLATLQFEFFFGAFYLFIINTVFIAFATFIIVRLMKFPFKQTPDKRREKIERGIVWVVVLGTLLPSIYFGMEMVQQARFTESANRFIVNEAHFTNNYLLNKKINAKRKSIILVFGGNEILPQEIEKVKTGLNKYNLENSTLEIKQGFAYLPENKDDEQNEQFKQLTKAYDVKDKELQTLKLHLDSINNQHKISEEVFSELKVHYPSLQSAVLQPSLIVGDSSVSKPSFLVLLSFSSNLTIQEKSKIENWLRLRLHQDTIKLIFQ